ncbi:hypothetical protein FOC4_g10004905 [Fusarium odoratissimum]|uniref:Zn(2)-C6 fungal-type domain-containing protein n=1 Tax=Fusarium oxysporum f. sp. cubense (strain race 4) TaxID=2502994 RepID=N1RX83_FUSC4|nr:hypothetical protein FOC4_g10004905 [Fusarium odoratissimum]
MKRLGYRKSRTGCLRCKERRVKCDEKRPCSACVRHEVLCSLSDSPPDAEHSSEPSLPPGKEQEDGAYNGHEDPFSFFAALFSNLILGERANWASDMELMHHYTSISYATLSNDADVQKFFQQDLPRLGFQHKFLLHQLLAFSGYHLAYLNHDKRHAFFSQASQHQNSAIEGLRTNLGSAHASEHCHTLYAASILLTICSFATFPSYDRFDGPLDPVDNILGVFSLIKGMNMIRLESGGEISTGPLATLFGRMQCGCPSYKDSGLGIIRPHVEQLSIALGQTPFLGNDAIHGSFVTQHAVASLSSSIENSIRRPSPTSTASLRASFLWPILIETDYITLLRQRYPAALVVLAFYCTVLRMAEASCWALEGWAESLMKCVCNSLEGSHWETLIEWPKQIVMGVDQDIVVKSWANEQL